MAVFAGRPALWVFVLLAWLVGTGEAFFTPARTRSRWRSRPRDQLGNANALYGLATSATRIGGPRAGRRADRPGRAGVVVAADAASYAVSVLALSLLRMPGGTAGADGRNPAAGNPWRGGPCGMTWPRAGPNSGPGPGCRYDRAVRLLQPDHLGALDAAWAGHRAAYLGGAAVWGAIMAMQGAGAIVAGLACPSAAVPRRPIVVATIGTFCYALPDVPMALHASAAWVAAAAFCCGAGSAVFSTFYGTALQQQVPPEMLARVSALSSSPPTASA